jgi:hypothetical protein
MAKKSSSTSRGSGSRSRARSTPKSRAVATRAASNDDDNGAADAFLRILQSPFVADLLAVAATAALAALAEHGFSSGGGKRHRAGKAMKEAGKAAAAAIGRRLGTEVDEIRKAAKSVKDAAKA